MADARDHVPNRRTGRDRRDENHDKHIPPSGIVVWNATHAVMALGGFAAALIAILAFAGLIGVRWGPREDASTMKARVDTIAAGLKNVQADMLKVKARQYLACSQAKIVVSPCEDILK